MEDSGAYRAKPRDPDLYSSSLHDLPLVEGDERRMVFRRAFAELSRETFDGPGPLEGVPPAMLAAAAKSALEAGLVDDLDWLAPEAAGRALFTFASALPPGAEQREFGRRALSRLLAGNATTFAAIATVMARTGAKAFSSAPVIARTALLVELPLSAGVSDGVLAFTLAVRRQLAREWILGPSTRSLAARRLAGKVIERAASELVRRAEQHMTSSTRFFVEDGPLRTAHERLLADRESLVWRHAAIARGLVAAGSGEVMAAIEAAISPALSPTEWRRAATSIAAHAAVRPEAAVKLAAKLFESDIPKRDAGVHAAFLWGLTRAAETEPEAATELFRRGLAGPPDEVAEAVLFMKRELGPCPFVDEALRLALDALTKSAEARPADDGAVALRKELLRDLDGTPRDDDPLRQQIDDALELFASEGARAAHAKGLDVLSAASATVVALEALVEGADTPMARRTSYSVLRDLDASLLERDVLVALLRLDTNVDKARAHEETLGGLRTRVARFILGREAAGDGDPAGLPEPTHLVLHLSRLRALLHLVDSDATGWAPSSPDAHVQSEDAERSRWQIASEEVLKRIESRPSRALRRALLATLARSLDGLVRTQSCDVVDALLVVSANITDARDFDALGEASMDPDLRVVLSAYAAFLRAADRTEPTAKGESDFPGPQTEPRKLAALEALAEALLAVGSARSEALRAVLTRIAASLSTLASASSLKAIASASGEIDVVVRLEASAYALANMTLGARRRIFDQETTPPSRLGARALTTAIARVLSGSDEVLDADSLALGATQLSYGAPRAIGALVQSLVTRLGTLPHDGSMLPNAPVMEEPLPDWVPARRVLGAFYVLRPLSSGAAGSVFVVCRTEDKRDPDAERFALKVPDFSANAARHLSETEFFNLFRAEASALVALPPHPNLAQLVTFDLAARPRPILVMELVEGPSLERVIEGATLDVPKAFRLLDEVLAGLEIMHDANVGHLDVKPANVVLRGGESAVLVDFGLAGRNIRPGCASGPYGAPEVWGATPEGSKPKPMPADVYAFGCLAFEVLTSWTLFDEASEVALISSHIAHDGLPPKLRELSQNPLLSPLVELLFSTLRRDPSARLPAREVRSELAKVRKRLEGLPWPLTSKRG